MSINDKSQSFVKERMLRFKPVVFLRKHLPALIFAILFSLSILFGLWDIKQYEIYDYEGREIPTKVTEMMKKYLDDNVTGHNFFLINSHNLEKELAINVSYIHSAKVSKSVPNKMVVIVNLLEPKLVSFTKDNSCNLLSEEGIVLEKLCLDSSEVQKCCEGYLQEPMLYEFVSNDLDISKIENSKEQLLVMKNISKIVKIVESFGSKVTQVSVKNKIVDIVDSEGRISKFTTAEEIDIQLSRYLLVVTKMRNDGIKYSSIDVRFERPVVKI